ncbi:MAG TPA: hypothetical protein VGF94_20085 [Kofleriaceae bacterium]
MLALGALEVFVRARGYRPSVKDDEYAWAWQRARVDGDPHAVALLGTSRILLAFSRDAFEHALPGWTPVQLAVDGSQPAGSLVDLAADPDFRGVAIVDTTETGITLDNLPRQAAYVRAFHRRWREPGAMIERWLATHVQSTFALLSDSGLHYFENGWRVPPYVRTFADRTQYGDFTLRGADLRRKQLARIAATPPVDHDDSDAWLGAVAQMEPYIDAIQARGGRVVYVRMPTCDERWAADQRDAPKVRYWDRFAARTHALAIHFADYPELRAFACPDTSHLDSKDAPAFTRALVAILVARGVFR